MRPQDKALKASICHRLSDSAYTSIKRSSFYETLACTPHHVFMEVLGSNDDTLLATFQAEEDARAYAKKMASSGDYPCVVSFTVPSLNLAFPAMG